MLLVVSTLNIIKCQFVVELDKIKKKLYLSYSNHIKYIMFCLVLSKHKCSNI